jgi:hypothetical protein
MCIDLVGGIKSKYDTIYVYDYFDNSNIRHYRVLCSTDQSMVKVFFLKDDDALKMTRYYAGVDSFIRVHFIEPDYIEKHISTQLNPDTVAFFSYEEEALFKRILNIKNN